jgi:hypothetical protein
MLSQKYLENWVSKRWLAILLAGLLPVWGAIIWLLSISSHGRSTIIAIVLMIPLGLLNILITLSADLFIIRRLVALAIFGFFFGWVTQDLWNRNRWMRLTIIAFLILNSCIFLVYILFRLD